WKYGGPKWLAILQVSNLLEPPPNRCNSRCRYSSAASRRKLHRRRSDVCRSLKLASTGAPPCNGPGSRFEAYVRHMLIIQSDRPVRPRMTDSVMQVVLMAISRASMG